MAMYLGDKPVKAVLSILPDEYQEVEYIESTGTQYIDTGVLQSEKFKMIADVKLNYTKSTGSKGRSGAIITGSKGWTVFGDYGFGYLAALFCKNIRKGVEIPFDNEWHTYHIENGLQKIDENTSNETVDYISSDINLWLLGVNINYNEPQTYAQMLKKAKIFENNILIRNFIPCYRKSDNEIGLYDTVNNKFYTNAGTGNFLKGENKTTIREFTAPIKKCVGKNLFDISRANVVVDGEYFNNTLGASGFFYTMRVIAGKTYTINFTVYDSYATGVGSRLVLAVMAGKNISYNKGTRLAIRLKSSDGEYTATMKFTVPDGVSWISLTGLATMHFKDFMLNEGDTALPYEPYREWYEY